MAPTNIRPRFVVTPQPTLFAAWDTVAGASGYAVALLDDAGVAVQPQPDFKVGGETAGAINPVLVMGYRYQVQVAATAGEQVGPAAAVGFMPFAIAAPAGLVCLVSGTTISAIWQSVANATGYVVEIVNDDGGPVTPAPQVEVKDASASITGGGLQVRQQYRVVVRGVADDVEGSKRSRAFGSPKLRRQSSPRSNASIPRTHYPLDWQPIADPAATYTCELVPKDQPDHIIDSARRRAAQGRRSTSGRSFRPASTRCGCAPQVDDVVSAWATQGVAKLAVPAFDAGSSGNPISVRWMPVAGAVTYQIELTGPPGFTTVSGRPPNASDPAFYHTFGPSDPDGAYVFSVMPLAAGVQIASSPGHSQPIDRKSRSGCVRRPCRAGSRSSGKAARLRASRSKFIAGSDAAARTADRFRRCAVRGCDWRPIPAGGRLADPRRRSLGRER